MFIHSEDKYRFALLTSNRFKTNHEFWAEPILIPHNNRKNIHNDHMLYKIIFIVNFVSILLCLMDYFFVHESNTGELSLKDFIFLILAPILIVNFLYSGALSWFRFNSPTINSFFALIYTVIGFIFMFCLIPIIIFAYGRFSMVFQSQTFSFLEKCRLFLEGFQVIVVTFAFTSIGLVDYIYNCFDSKNEILNFINKSSLKKGDMIYLSRLLYEYTIYLKKTKDSYGAIDNALYDFNQFRSWYKAYRSFIEQEAIMAADKEYILFLGRMGLALSKYSNFLKIEKS